MFVNNSTARRRAALRLVGETGGGGGGLLLLLLRLLDFLRTGAFYLAAGRISQWVELFKQELCAAC